MKKTVVALCVMCLLAVINIQAGGDVKDLNTPVPENAKKLVTGVAEMIDQDRFAEADSALKKAITISPNYVNAHSKYIELQTRFLNHADDVRREYENLMKKEPDNPIYPMALANSGLNSLASRNAFLQKVVTLAPDWIWAHYAQAILISEKEPEKAVTELTKFIETDGSWLPAYYNLANIQETRLKKLDDAIATREKVVAHPDSGSSDLVNLWRRRIGKAGGTDAAKNELKSELQNMASTSKSIRTLDAVRMAYKELLDDKEQPSQIEKQIRRIDPGWYPERGRASVILTTNISGAPRTIFVANRQFSNSIKLREFAGEMEATEKLSGLMGVLSSLKLSDDLKRYTYERIFVTAEQVKDIVAMTKYGDMLIAGDPRDTSVPARMAIVLADKKNAQAALRYANMAEQATATFQPYPRPVNYQSSEEEWKKEFPEERQQRTYKFGRATALQALGWVYYQAGDTARAETTLRQSVEFNRSEKSLRYLSEVLGRLGKTAEAEGIAKDAKNLFTENVKRSLQIQPSKDFELATLDGRKVKLSDLKGKIVLIDFWTTWCTPCIQSMPKLSELYAKYKDKGLEILYISADSEADRYKVAPLVQKKSLNFPVMLDRGEVQSIYDVKSFPTTIVVDREGKIRHRSVGLSDDTHRTIETIIELLT